jgi:PTS system cellobiose-specific IIB component
MLRIAICCGGGFSSSTMAAHLNKQLAESEFKDDVFLEFIPFSGLWGESAAFSDGQTKERQDEVDVALCCPHLEYPAKTAVKEGRLRIPVFILPMRLYGQISIDQVVEEAEDVLELWNNGAQNPILFPDEPRSMTATRNVSHRRWLAQKNK